MPRVFCEAINSHVWRASLLGISQIKLRSRHSSEQEEHQDKQNRLRQKPQNFPNHKTHDLILRAGSPRMNRVNKQESNAEDFTPKPERRKRSAAHGRVKFCNCLQFQSLISSRAARISHKTNPGPWPRQKIPILALPLRNPLPNPPTIVGKMSTHLVILD